MVCAKNVGVVHPSEVEAADRLNVFLPVAITYRIRAFGAVAVCEEVEELAGFASSLPAAVVVADSVDAHLASLGSVFDADRQDTIGSLGLGSAFNLVDGVSDAVGVESERMSGQDQEQREILHKISAVGYLLLVTCYGRQLITGPPCRLQKSTEIFEHDSDQCLQAFADGQALRNLASNSVVRRT